MLFHKYFTTQVWVFNLYIMYLLIECVEVESYKGMAKDFCGFMVYKLFHFYLQSGKYHI